VPEAAVVAWIQAAIQLCSAVQLCLPRSGIYKGDNIPLESSSCSSVNSYISCVQLDAECLLRLCPCNTYLPYKLAHKPPLCGPCETNALSQEGAYRKGIYYGRWSVRHTNFTATLRQEGAYKPGGLIAKGGLIC